MEGVLMTNYLMEHPLEAERLELKTRREKILKELKLVPLSPGMEVLDVDRERSGKETRGFQCGIPPGGRPGP
jgi:hypothetical protein